MITFEPYNYYKSAGEIGDCSLGNVLDKISGTIGIAVKNGYDYGFKPWVNQKYFVNPLPVYQDELPLYKLPVNYKGFDIGFCGFNIPDNRRILGELASYLYFEHCEELIRYYFSLKNLTTPYKDCIILHHRDFKSDMNLDKKYYNRALKHFPPKKVVVITNNIVSAKNLFEKDYEFASNTPIIDLYLLSKAKYLIMANSSLSRWGAFLSGAHVVAPLKWYHPGWSDCETKDMIRENWILT
jgi:hypothetical protein